ncbi:unnamed protein product [Clonostachys rosea]|uniref:Actin-like protein N-terminal domain-containing protein n=1 Tax=Bionectria ochroleuca TaxID=29856 RepID=A0ABY6U7V3_BIOOC|nr:unnamed protein product [Clonostachys rosea]
MGVITDSFRLTLAPPYCPPAPQKTNRQYRNIPRVETILDIQRPAGRNKTWDFTYTPRTGPVPRNVELVRFIKVLMMIPRSDRPGDKAMIADIKDSWTGKKIDGEYDLAVTFLKPFFLHRLETLKDLRGLQSEEERSAFRPAIVMTQPYGWSTDERDIFKLAVTEPNIKEFGCGNCDITYVEEQDAAICYSLLQFHSVLRQVCDEQGSFLVADFGGITDDYGVFKFGRGNDSSGLPGTTVIAESHFMGAHSLTLAAEKVILKRFQKKYMGNDDSDQEQILKDLFFEVTKLIDAVTKKKATKIAALIRKARTKVGTLKYIVLTGGFSLLGPFRESLEEALRDKLGNDAPVILFSGTTANTAVQYGALVHTRPDWFGLHELYQSS